MAYVLDRRGRIWAWGSGSYGQLGNGRRLTLARPTPVLWPFAHYRLTKSSPTLVA